MPDATKNATTSPSTKPDQSTTIIGSSSSENIGTTTTTINNDNNNNNETDGEDMLLVTEFPPPPYYYTLASHNKLTPPEIPHRAFRVAAKRVRQEKERARLESERIRLEAEVKDDSGDGDVGSGDGDGEDKSKDVVMTTTTDNQQQQDSNNNNNDDDDDSIADPNNPNEPIVAVFGEIVEDPTLLLHTDQEDCNNPTILRDNVKRLNRSVLQGFLKLVSKLVHDPIENKSSRDELSHDIFLMLQECNKFREHQAREILIETLERQLERREGGWRCY
ncbi:hypothetical protein QTG54_007677, partial [Skeletonema marinoi]